MSEQLTAAAQAMGIPEALVERSARARADATGQSYDDVLAAWAGGETVASAPAEPEPASEDAAPAADEPTPEPATQPTPEPAAEPQPAAAPAAAPQPASAPAVAQPAAASAGPGRPPVLDAPPDRPLVPIGGGIAVVVLMLLLGFVFPSLPAASNEVRSSAVPLSEAGEEGRQVYQRAGCASCHTQSVRSVVADVGVGPVTLGDTNQVIGYRRLGPDLSNVGSRLSRDQISAIVVGPSHPPVPLSQNAMRALATYLGESALAEVEDESQPESEEETDPEEETNTEEGAEEEGAGEEGGS